MSNCENQPNTRYFKIVNSYNKIKYLFIGSVSNEHDESFQGAKVFKYPRTARRKFCGHICSIKYHNKNYSYDHFQARHDLT